MSRLFEKFLGDFMGYFGIFSVFGKFLAIFISQNPDFSEFAKWYLWDRPKFQPKSMISELELNYLLDFWEYFRSYDKFY